MHFKIKYLQNSLRVNIHIYTPSGNIRFTLYHITYDAQVIALNICLVWRVSPHDKIQSHETDSDFLVCGSLCNDSL